MDSYKKNLLKAQGNEESSEMSSGLNLSGDRDATGILKLNTVGKHQSQAPKVRTGKELWAIARELAFKKVKTSTLNVLAM